MHNAQRIEHVGAGLAFKHRQAIADLDQPKTERLRNRRRRKLTVNQSLHDLQAGHPGNLIWLGDAVA